MPIDANQLKFENATLPYLTHDNKSISDANVANFRQSGFDLRCNQINNRSIFIN